jgi:hypothetical protein
MWYLGQLGPEATDLFEGFKVGELHRVRHRTGYSTTWVDQSLIYFSVDGWQRQVTILSREKTRNARRRRVLSSELAASVIVTEMEAASEELQLELSCARIAEED